jgi:hypothetical protein
VEDKEYIVIATDESMAFDLCKYADHENWSIRKLGIVTPDVADAVECGVISTVTY